jgi:ATP-binding cassette subfamily C protein LapB
MTAPVELSRHPLPGELRAGTGPLAAPHAPSESAKAQPGPAARSPDPHGNAASADTREWNIDARDVIDDPLLMCLYELTRLLGRPMSREALVAGLPLEKMRLTPRLFVRAANRAGFVARVSRVSIDEGLATLCPVVALLSGERALLVTEVDRIHGTAQVVRPEAPGHVATMPMAELRGLSIGFAISVKNRYSIDSRAPLAREAAGTHWFWGALLRPWRTYRDVLAASLLINLFALAMPLFTMNLYDRIVPNSAFETLWTFAIGLCAVLGFDLAMKVVRAWFIDLAGKRVDHEMSSRVMAKVLNLRLEARPKSVGSFASNLRSFESVREFLTSASLGLLIDLPFALLFLVVTALLGGWLALPTALAFVAVVGISFLAQRQLKPLTDSTQQANQQRHSTLIEALVGIETIKALNVEGRTQRRWEESGRLLAEQGAKIKLVNALAVQGTAWVSQMVTLSTVVLGVYLIADSTLSMGALIACTQLSGRALAPLGQLAALLVQYDGTRSAYQGISQIMALPEERADSSRFVMRPRMQGGIEFDRVSFTYPGGDRPSLDGVSFKIARGERVALIGRIGSGKSTIEKLVLGLYQPTGGTVRFDGIDSQQIDPAEIRGSIGYLPQDPTLFFGTLRENIAIACPYADDSAVLRAAEVAGLRSFIERHPQGINLPISERGESLSGGQRQAVALARALIADPPVLLLDEPTSSMDSESEARVLAHLGQVTKGRTVLLVTHRTTLLNMVDRVIVVDDAKIVMDGPKDTVLAELRGR